MSTTLEAGTFWDVTRDEYDADETCLRSSALKTFIEDRDVYREQYVTKTLPPFKASDAMKFGTAFHAWLLEGTKPWVVCTIPKTGNAWKEFKAAHAGQAILDVEDNNSILRMADAVRANPLALELIEAGHFPENAGKWQHKSGVWCKLLTDMLHFDGTIVDIKTVADPTPYFFAKQVRDYGYDISAAFYMQGRKAIIGVDGAFKFITVCTKPTYKVMVHELDPIDIEIANRTIDSALESIAKCRESGDWSDPETKVVHTVQIPGRFYGR